MNWDPSISENLSDHSVTCTSAQWEASMELHRCAQLEPSFSSRPLISYLGPWDYLLKQTQVTSKDGADIFSSLAFKEMASDSSLGSRDN